MVWGVCRRLLRNHHDAEDAFQATFLVLVRKASSIASRELLANWLYGVARQTSLKARTTIARRHARERQVTDMPEAEATPPEAWTDLQAILDQELGRLPDRYRIVLVLCDLESRTRKEAAEELRLPQGTVASRLARARTMLAKRLTQRGVALSGGALAAALSQQAAMAGVPASVVSRTVQVASLVVTGKAATGIMSINVAVLTEGVTNAMLVSKITRWMVGLLVLSLIALGGGLAAQHVVGTDSVKAEKEAAGAGPGSPDATPPKTVSPPGQRAAAPFEIFTGRLEDPKKAGLRGPVQVLNPMGVGFEMDERSYLRYQRLLRAGKVKGAGDSLAVGLADEHGFPRGGVLDHFEPEFNPATGTISVCGVLPNSDGLLRPGMFVRVRLEFGPPAGAGGAAKGSDFQNPEMEKFQGVWQMESLIGPQGQVPKEDLKGRSLVIDGNTFIREEQGKPFAEGLFAIDTTVTPKVLVMIATDRAAAQVWALYELDGDTLKVCYELLGKGRPTEFKASSTQSVAVYRRQKP
jgi:RNA polymerase sigma factor (sigma-70 family)